MRFFKLLRRNFSKLVKLNLIFFLPMLVVLLFIVALGLVSDLWVVRLPGDTWLDIQSGFVAFLPVIALFPFIAGLTYVTRSFVREEFVFIWYDFWQAVKDNWKVFLLNGVVCYLVYAVLTISIFFYFNLGQAVALWICVMLAVLFLFAQFYLPILFITFNLTFRQAYKNAFIFAIVGLARNLLLAVIFLIALLLFYISLLTFNFVIFLPLSMLFLFSFLSFLVNYTVYPVIKRYLIKK